MAGIRIDLLEADQALAAIIEHATRPNGMPLAVVSINLDHIHHFAPGQRWHGTLDEGPDVEFLNLLDGAPLVAQVARTTGRSWPRLAGSDLIDPVLDAAAERGVRVGFLGGSPETQATLRDLFATERPGLAVSGWWAPSRDVLTDPEASAVLADQIRVAGTDLLVVGLGKPRQELWMSRYGAASGARVLLGFGAAVDFLAGNVERAPRWVSERGLEWSWRLVKEPSRLARRYLLDGPPAYLAVRRNRDNVTPARTARPVVERLASVRGAGTGQRDELTPGRFAPPGTHADVTVLAVTYRNADDIDRLIGSLREETRDARIRVVVADNSPDGGTLDALNRYDDVIAFSTGGNLGYAAGLNAAAERADLTDTLLVLNPDLRVERGSVLALRARMSATGAGIVVPALLDDDGTIYRSLRREPSLTRSFGDAVLGSRLPWRPAWLSEIDHDDESYQHPHRIDWATGAALLVRADVAAALGPWDERYFLYSEETDYFRRFREAGWSVWYEPAARMWHSRGGSGASPQLVALIAVNKVRYARAHRGSLYALGMRALGAAGALARPHNAGDRVAARYLLGVRPWEQLPRAVPAAPTFDAATLPHGAVIIPAHNEESVIARTLTPLAPLAAAGAIDVVVACNGCSDRTAEIARGFPGMTVLDLATASKTAALNAADAATGAWPRLYLDADIEITAATLQALFLHLSEPERLAARPVADYDTDAAGPLVRAYYRARRRVPELHRHLWGAGAYAVSAAGHARLGRFPDVTADDAWADSRFAPEEKQVIATTPVVIRTPRTTGALVATLGRVYGGVAQLDGGEPVADRGSGSGLRNLLASIDGARTTIDAAVYAGIVAAARLRLRLSAALREPGHWARDESSR
ncbi:WecB/TagA/CpsF family glycosyltransferase [Tersicoccus phoenicis]|uniref:WecB/TagA/CpsF family glycosyltransferase n=1 Tax=Tersicoccus phoenicis TaxID=554083 RepID=UPI0013562DF5|nr:WecB/TagA/CpsF family glycosyltransferase [Tersicoccus phoenicis]